MATIRLADGTNIEYWERPDSPQESYASGVGKARRIIDVKWKDRLKFLAGMIGWSEPVYDAAGTFLYVKRVPPIPYPPIEVPNNKLWTAKKEANDYWFYATSIDSIEPLGIDRSDKYLKNKAMGSGNFEVWAETKDEMDMFRHDRARITLSYDALPYRVTSDADMKSLNFVTNAGIIDESFMWRYVSRSVQPHSEHLTLPFGTLKYEDTAPGGLVDTVTGKGIVATTQTGRIIPTIDFTWTWHQVPGIPEQAFNMMGCINSQPIYDYSPGTGRAWTYATGTLLFTGMELKTYRMSTGIYCNDVVYRMKYFSALEPHTGVPYSPARGHNYVLAFHNPVGTGASSYSYSYQKLVDSSDAARGIYQTADLRQLFTLPNQS